MNKTQLVILGILDKKNRWMFGLEMIKVSNKKLKRGTIYVHLSTLQDEGFIDSRKEPNFTLKYEEQLPRQQYHITHNGRRAYQDMISSNNEGLRPIQV